MIVFVFGLWYNRDRQQTKKGNTMKAATVTRKFDGARCETYYVVEIFGNSSKFECTSAESLLGFLSKHKITHVEYKF